MVRDVSLSSGSNPAGSTYINKIFKNLPTIIKKIIALALKLARAKEEISRFLKSSNAQWASVVQFICLP